MFLGKFVSKIDWDGVKFTTHCVTFSFNSTQETVVTEMLQFQKWNISIVLHDGAF